MPDDDLRHLRVPCATFRQREPYRTRGLHRQQPDAEGISRTEREVSYYADKLHVSPKYLSDTVSRITGTSVTTYIANATVPIIKELLADEQLSLTQIADMMNFNTLSYFCRYCKKHLGKTPSEYRKSLQPKR